MMGRLIIYEGSDEEIRKYLFSLPTHTPSGPTPPTISGAPTANGSDHLDLIARAFRKQLEEAAADGRKGQMNALTAWLKQNGSIELTELWKASGVKNQHDYGGIGSSLTRNMKKVGGLKNWYTAERHPRKPGEWIYTVVPEMVGPLRRAFSI
ncbi:MAG: hypothetical protein ACHP8B_09190 [Terriglobales bacterium]